MMNKELTKDSITGAIFDSVKVRLGEHWMTSEDTIEVTLKQDEESNSANIYVLSLNAAYQLRHQLGQALDAQMREWAKNQPKNWTEFADWNKLFITTTWADALGWSVFQMAQ